jgi:putative transposase
LGTQTALTLFDGVEFQEITNPRFTQQSEEKIRQTAKLKRRKRAPKRDVKAARRWKKINQRESRLKAQHKVTSDIACCYDIGATEQLNSKGMTRKGGRRKAGLNKSILSVGFGAWNQMLSCKIEQTGGLVLRLPTKTIKPCQRCPQCGAVHGQT